MPSGTYTHVVRPVAGVAVKRAAVSAASAGAAGNELVAAIPGKRICVLAACLISSGNVVATFHSGDADAGSPLSGPLTFAANGGFALDAPIDANLAWLVTEPGNALTLHLSAAVPVGGFLAYFEQEAA